MPRNVKVEENDEDTGAASGAGKFLDSLPGAMPEDDDDDDDDDDDADDDDDDDDDDDEDDEDDDDDDDGEPMPIAARTQVDAPETLQSLPPTPTPSAVPRKSPPQKRASTSKSSTQNETFIPRNPTGIRGPRSLTPEQSARSPALNAARNFQESAYQEIDSLLASLNFATREYEVRVDRLEPDRDENDVPCSGHLADYKDKVTIGDISRRFGGGVYLIRIFGPHPTTGRAGIIKQERFKVAGPPKPMKSQKDSSVSKPQETAAMTEILRTISETNERSQQRVVDLLERTRDQPSAIETVLPAILPVIEKFFSKSEESTRAILEAQKEDRRRDEQRREEETRRETERRAEQRREEEKREDRRREEERRAEDARRATEVRAEELRREEMREERLAEAEARKEERERAREERERIKEEAKSEAAERQRQHERELAAQAERSRQEQQQQQQFMQMMQSFNQAQMDALAQRQENGGIAAVTSQMLALKELSNSLTGADREPSGMEKFTEGLERVVGTVMPVAQQVMSASSGRRASQPQPQQQQQQQRAPIVVDIGPRRPALPVVAQQAPTPTQTATPIQNPASASSASSDADEMKVVNDFTDFVKPSTEDDMLAAGTKLIKNVDLAVQRNLTAEQIVKQILEPFEQNASMVMSMLSGMDTEQILEFIEGNVPPEWAILSPRGEELVTKAFELWADEGKRA